MLEAPDGETRLFPILGDPIRFVKSPQQLTLGFARRGHNGVCIPMHVAQSGLDPVMQGLARTRNVDGLLVTMPHKHAAFAYCGTCSDTSRRLGAVSVMRRNRDGTWHGDMLDGQAFVGAQLGAGARPAGARVLLIGAGAAGSAIAIALLGAGVRELIIHDADEARVARLLRILDLRGGQRAISGPPDPTGCDIVCHATPTGMANSDPLPVAAHRLQASMFVADVVAGHGVTPLMQAARAAGCATADGVQMVQAVQEAMLDFMLGL
ncbi:MAG: shikimate dehydrogenase [Burkholderiales bacterium]|nr:shikimate dehydrogenase [Burkholderiales bacterium]MDE1926227.1 shikimate dehydrogenase [Burkholderiales bacterium]MDE2159904.1 shikimate dehydrogenase [Burkholderiales bacterium]MDE2501607.1 shikimate dehydrogenase [Burkholderiales bacterium]